MVHDVTMAPCCPTPLLPAADGQTNTVPSQQIGTGIEIGTEVNGTKTRLNVTEPHGRLLHFILRQLLFLALTFLVNQVSFECKIVTLTSTNTNLSKVCGNDNKEHLIMICEL